MASQPTKVKSGGDGITPIETIPVSPMPVSVPAVAESSQVSDDQSRDGDLTSTGSDEAIVALVLAGNKNAFQELVVRYERGLRALAFGIVRDRADAEEVVQEALVKAYLTLDRFRGDSSFKTYLYKITHNMAIDVRRRAQRRWVVVSSSEAVIEDKHLDSNAQLPAFGSQSMGLEPGAAFLQAEELAQVSDALGRISEEHRQVMVLREVEGMSYSQIAEIVGVSLGTVMSRLHYARKRLISLIGR